MKKDCRLNEEQIARRIAREIKEGYCVNLGAGQIPFLVSQSCPVSAMFHVEMGLLGVGKIAPDNEKDQDLIGLGRRAILAAPGASAFSSVDSLAMMRGKHFDMSILGAYQVAENGDLANWWLPSFVPQVGGAMDVASNVKKLVITMDHVTKEGKPKIVKECTLPITAKRVVSLIFTDMAFIEVTPKGLVLKEIAPGFTVEEIQGITEPKLIVTDETTTMDL
jgi:3-oxoacid CoA-transferase subunit B